MALDLHDAFGLPLRAQALRLFGLAHRAVALATVEAIVCMALFAVRLLRVDIRGRFGVALRVFGRRDRIQVLGVHAGPVAACVVHHVAVGNWLVGEPHREAMRFARRSPEGDHAVSVFVLQASPHDAVARLHALGIEAFQLLFCRPVHMAIMAHKATTAEAL